MVGSSKILTVSYGTFSCTLEGFDDPFSTMRSIAEYFRDLAADDRYFGAEPPTPDADMLHRIAQREVDRRVETSVKGDGIVLRQLEGEDAGAAGAVAGATVARAPNPAPEAASAAEDVAAPEPVMEPAAPPAVAEDAPVPAEEPPQDAQQEPVAEAATDEHPQPEESVEEPREEEAAFAAVENIYAEDDEPIADTVEEFVDEAPAAAPPAGDENSVAAKLSRIRAVVSGGANRPGTSTDDRFAGSIDAAFAGDGIEDAQFEDVTDEAPEPLAVDAEDVVADDEVGVDEATSATSEEPVEVEAAVVDEAVNDDQSENDAPVAAEVEEAESDAAAEVASETVAGDQGSLAARIVKLKRAAHEMSRPLDDRDDDDADLQGDDSSLATEADEVAYEDEDNIASEDAPQEAPAEDEIHGEQASDDDGDAAFDAMKAAIARAKELSQFDDVEDPAETDVPAEDAKEDHAERLSGFDTAKTEEAAFDRILEETNTKMDEDEGSRRRSAIAHLKAAVAATKADRLLKRTRPDQDAEEQSQYRNDLAKVVQPHRPVTQPRGDRDEMGNPVEASGEPTPLVLVSEQRVDQTADEGDAGMAQDPAMEDGAFADFAAKMGATDLPDLLEAAAAFTAFVEGNKMFSRPELMRRVSLVESNDEYTREAGLRSFGQLLRQGKIQKLKRGQFTIAEESRFNPQARLAGE